MTTPKPTSEEEKLPASPDNADQKTSEEGTGFFNRVRRNLNPGKTHPSEEDEIVVMSDDSDDRT
jgi:hypothetical protein